MIDAKANLNSNESIIAQAQLSTTALLAPLAVTAISAFGLFVNLGPGLNELKPLALLLFIVGILATLPALISRFTTQVILTEERLIAESGLVRRSQVDLRLDKLDRVEVKQSPLGKLLGYGTLVVTGRNVLRKSFPFIASPEEMRLKVRAQADNKPQNGS